MSRDSNIPRHAAVCRRPAGRLQQAVLPVALGGLVAGSVWLAADAAAAPAAHHCPSGPPARADATSPGGSTWAGSDGAWPDGDGRATCADRHYRHSRYYDGHDWRDHTDYPRYADRHRVVVQRPPAQPHHAPSAKTRPAGAVAAAQVRAGQAQPAHARAGLARAVQPEQLAQGAPAGAPAAIRSAAHPASRPRSAAVAAPGAATSTPRPDAVRRLSTATRSNLAAADTTPASTDYVALYGAIGGAALAALLGMGGVAIWRRRGTGGA
ncbi:MAG TPA: hypothetical protein VFT67_08205 [Jatrophihabitantaceae bacterium]|nr:hypothetical protein [Jatrophihabitantaceae bacterium]